MKKKAIKVKVCGPYAPPHWTEEDEREAQRRQERIARVPMENFVFDLFDPDIEPDAPLSDIPRAVYDGPFSREDREPVVQLLCLVQKWTDAEPWSERHILTEPLPATATVGEACKALDALYTEKVEAGRRRYFIECLHAVEPGLVLVKWGT